MHRAAAWALAVSAALSAPAAAQAPTPPPGRQAATSAPAAAAQPPLTGKERLSAKWMDEQRVDNCNVPPDKRGNRPRPDACAAAVATH
ncbi:hypothetical protein FHP25_01670 [Vineibacter terrae]|uniref:Uncharacterized protein n=1 Tax=Vineibacter terrae TaxID=2586908 RepID=A0A5C8PX18_9HYPH|nr:hypothetical protein [Vineibacter terrae]TXL82430.1 hypothetical protein FHP25_01670 [Vineibacter terrae]